MNNKAITINNKTSFLDGRNTENGWYDINLLIVSPGTWCTCKTERY